MIVTAKVQVTLEVSLLQPWDGSETFKHIHSVAAREAVDRVRQSISVPSGCDITIIGTPKVVTVSTEEAK